MLSKFANKLLKTDGEQPCLPTQVQEK